MNNWCYKKRKILLQKLLNRVRSATLVQNLKVVNKFDEKKTTPNSKMC